MNTNQREGTETKTGVRSFTTDFADDADKREHPCHPQSVVVCRVRWNQRTFNAKTLRRKDAKRVYLISALWLCGLVCRLPILTTEARGHREKHRVAELNRR